MQTRTLINLRRVLAAVQGYQRQHGRPATLPDICAITGMTKSTAWRMLSTLRRDYGYIRREPYQPGTLRSTEEYD